MAEELATTWPGDLRRDTPQRSSSARTFLGRTGAAVRTTDHLEFQLDHALARDAVHAPLDVSTLMQALHSRGLQATALQSRVSEMGAGRERDRYLRRPDLGRRLSLASAVALEALGHEHSGQPDVCFVLADGLSALALERHALPLLDLCSARLSAEGWTMAPVSVITQARVAVGDEVGALLHARMVVVLIGERPGLSAPDSLGAYITWEPRLGRTDAERNCISNIRLGGLAYTEAADRLLFYLRSAREMGRTGVALKWTPPTTLMDGVQVAPPPAT